MCIFHKWEYSIIKYKSKYMDTCVSQEYRQCKKCKKWQISIAMRWFDCNPPRQENLE